MKNLRLLFIIFTIYSAVAEAESLKCIQLVSQVSETKSDSAKESVIKVGKLNVRVVRDALSRVQSVQVSSPKSLKPKESAIRFPEILEQALSNETFSPNLKFQVDQNIALTGSGEFVGLEITRATVKGVEKVDLTINQYVEKISNNQTYVSVMTKGVDVPASFNITIGGEIKKISALGKHLKLKCE